MRDAEFYRRKATEISMRLDKRWQRLQKLEMERELLERKIKRLHELIAEDFRQRKRYREMEKCANSKPRIKIVGNKGGRR